MSAPYGTPVAGPDDGSGGDFGPVGGIGPGGGYHPGGGYDPAGIGPATRFGGVGPAAGYGPGGAAPGGVGQIRRGWRRKHTFLTLVLLVLLVLLLQVAITPWALHIGDTFTPTGHWSGVAEARTPDGSSYAVQLNLIANTLAQHDCSQNGCNDFHGSAAVCTATGRYSFTDLSGTVGGWLSTDGQPMKIQFRFGATAATKELEIELTGAWKGKVYQATDTGGLARDFQPDGTPRTAVEGGTVANEADNANLAFQPGDFDAACKQVIKA